MYSAIGRAKLSKYYHFEIKNKYYPSKRGPYSHASFRNGYIDIEQKWTYVVDKSRELLDGIEHKRLMPTNAIPKLGII